jgi:hypothetical protein
VVAANTRVAAVNTRRAAETGPAAAAASDPILTFGWSELECPLHLAA